MKKLITILAVLALLCIAASCGEEQSGWPTKGSMGEAVCPQGQHITTVGTSYAAACAWD